MPVDFSSLLADTLSNRGYEVEDASPVEGASGASYPVSMVAHRDGDRFLVDALASRTVRDEDVQAVASIVDDAGLEGAIVLALRGDEHSPQAPGADRVEVWGRAEVEQAVGALVVDGHLGDGTEADDIGPTPVDPYAAGEEQPAETETTEEPDTEPEPASPPTGASGPAGSTNGSHGQTQPDPDPEPQNPSPQTTDPDPEPEPEPEPQTAQADEDPIGDDVDERDFVDPEDMLERAEQLMQKGAVDDGDAELIEDEDPAPEPEPEPATGEAEPDEAAASADPDPSRSRPDPQSPDEIQPDPETDAEILEPEPDDSQRPQPEGQPPEPETASTARESESPEPEPDPDPASTGTASPAAAAGPAHDDEAFVSGAAIEPEVDEAEALRTAEGALFEADRARLELLPFRVYRYRAQLEGDGHTREEEGRVWVSTQSGAVVRAPRGDRVEEPEVAHERFQGSLSTRDTAEAAREHLLDTLERREELRQDYSESAVIERVRLEPDPQSLDIELLGKAYAPRWRVEGQNGTVFVDAVTGELVND
jgi:outer membrane biosynthesis protein TonB